MFLIVRLAAVMFALDALSSTSLIVLAEDSPKKTVVIESYKFSPSQIRVKKGAAVTFVNKDAAPHTVSPANKDDFVGTGRLLKDEKKIVVFDHVGRVNYFCDFHPSMEGVVVVTEK